MGPVAIGVLVLLVGGPVVLAVPLLAATAALRPRWLPAISAVAMLLAGFIAATAAAPAAVGSGTFGSAAQACALVALAAALMPRVTPAAYRDGWQPARPLPAPGRVPPLPAPDRPLDPLPLPTPRGTSRGGVPPPPAAPVGGGSPARPAPDAGAADRGGGGGQGGGP
jgi:arabinofuranan 3-O-arabinosyltransferase